MGKMELKERKDIALKYKWDIESLYEDTKQWEEDLKKVLAKIEDFEKYKGKLSTSGQVLLDALNDLMELYKYISKIYTYANMKLDEDTRVSSSQEKFDKALSAYTKFQEKSSFLTPEILSISDDTLNKFLNEVKDLKLYEHYLKNIVRMRAHVLSSKEENILAQMGEIAAFPQKVYSMLNDADIKFPNIKDENGVEVEITQGNFIPLMENRNRKVRRAAYEGLYSTYKNFKNTFAQSLNGIVKSNIVNSRIRKYNSALEASLDKNNIPVSVYKNLINSIHNNLDSMYKYMEIRKRALGVDKLHMYDLYTPIVKDVDFNIPYEKGQELIINGLYPLKDEYVSIVKEGFNNRWIDVYENKGKRSGAYSSGAYGSKPFILMNYHDTLDSVFTLAHEMGHSIHSYLTQKNQPLVYANYSIFLAEVASTTNEALLLDYMIKKAKNDNEKLYLLNHYLEQFRTTVFRQTMFAEFEMLIYEHVEKGGALTADYLCEIYKKLNETYYGPNVVVDDYIAIEWARIPHFYYNFYVFQYATGFSAAVALSQKILNEGDKAVENYLEFLKSGSSDYPINILKKAGVDMTTEEPVNNALKVFEQLVEEMDRLI